MTATPQRFPLPNIPFRRELHSGCAIGTSITCTAQAFEAKPKTFSIQLISANDIAILVTVPIAKSGQTYFNNDHVMDFVHRVNPSEIKAVAIEGPLIVDEVVFTPPQGACLDPLPTYEEATGSSINPVPELRYMNIGKTNGIFAVNSACKYGHLMYHLLKQCSQTKGKVQSHLNVHHFVTSPIR
uniref:Galectin domain-containing protein n=1 Tax=Angiostrongylus cantonensis TaxID=6313 RepID=A0A0K0DRF1_ANGCA